MSGNNKRLKSTGGSKRGGARAGTGGARVGAGRPPSASAGDAHAKAGAPVENTKAAGPHHVGAGAPVENTYAAGSHHAGAGGARSDAGAPLENLNATGAGAPLENLNATGAGAPLENLNATGAGAPLENHNAAGLHRAGAGGARLDAGALFHNLNATGSHRAGAGGARTDAGASLGNRNAAGPHRPATVKAAQVAYDEKVSELQKSANCANDPFDVPILESDQSRAMKAIAAEFEAAKRIVTCCVCDNFKQESDTHLLSSTMDEPPPETWMTPLKECVNSIIIHGAPDPYSLDRQYRVVDLQGMSPAWKSILLSPRGIYEVQHPTDIVVQDKFVYPKGSFADLHVDKELTHASFAKACVCTTCAKSLKNGKKPQFACANDLCIGNLFSLHNFFNTFRKHSVGIQ